MNTTATSVRKALEEIHLLKCSLLLGELLEFTEHTALWNGLLDAYALDPDASDASEFGATQPAAARFRVKLEASSAVWFDVELPLSPGTHGEGRWGEGSASVSVKGDHLGRAEQERWQAIVADAAAQGVGVGVGGSSSSEYPLYEMISAHLLPQLHTYLDEQAQVSSGSEPIVRTAAAPSSSSPSPSSAPRFHALFVSHHLKAPQKRRSLSQWSHELSLVGFAKVGYPGVIYCEGAQEDVEDFVDRVKSMQWLALRLRFIEPAPLSLSSGTAPQDSTTSQCSQWSEFEKVGEVVEEMRRLGREQFVVEMGIGSAGNAPPGK